MNNKFKILMITARADRGGGPKYLDVFISCLKNSSVMDVFIACPKDEPYFGIWSGNPRVKEVVEIPHRRLKLTDLFKLANFIKSKGITIVHSHGKGAGVYSRLLKLLIPRLIVVHSFHGFHVNHLKGFTKKFYIFFERICSNLTTQFINVSKGEQAECLANKVISPNKASVIYNGIVPLIRIENAREKLSLPMDKIIVTTISRFDVAKNMNLAFQIAKNMECENDIVFLWIGDGEEKVTIENKIIESGIKNVIMTGFKDNISEYLSASDLYLSTSRMEGLPLSPLEAASIGIPVVATDVVGNNEILINGETGLLFPLNDVENACKNILLLIRDKEFYIKASALCKKMIEEKFSAEKMVDETISIYQCLIKS